MANVSLTRFFMRKSGANVPHRKNTAESATEQMPLPKKVVIPMQQHLGAPCLPVVKPGDYVYLGQKVGDSTQFISAPIHSSVSGTVTEVAPIPLPFHDGVMAVTIEPDGMQAPHPDIRPVDVNTREELVAAVRECGLVGLGGAGFPTHVKLNPPKDSPIDTLVVNGAECEPYITADYREIMENSWDILSGVYTVSQLLGINRTIIAIEDNKPQAIKILSDIAANSADVGDKVTIQVLRSRYPQGAEKVLIAETTGREVPKGKLPSDVGVVVMNITSVAFLARYLKTGMPLISKRLTVDGSAIAEPKNVEVLIGTPVEDVVNFCGGFQGEVGKVLMGGPMMGIALVDGRIPVLKQNNAILAFDRKDAGAWEPTSCIRCGKCVEGCPMNLMPTSIVKESKAGNLDGLERLSVMTCMECGTCSYLCPAHIPLVQTIKLAKSQVKSQGGKKA